MRVIARKERPHPGAQLRITDVNGWRVTAFATNTPPGGPGSQLPELELRHRSRPRAEDRIRSLKDGGLRNLPLHGFDQNKIWLAVVALAADLLAWMQTLAFEPYPARSRKIEATGRCTGRAGAFAPAASQRFRPVWNPITSSRNGTMNRSIRQT